MVGFGKSLRMARRSGWEGGYLDYETLKLLLSQIEAVYEEEAHRASNPYEFAVDHHRSSRRRRSNRHNASGQRDYRDDLFLESDSEAAFASLHNDDDDQSIRSTDDLHADEAAAGVPKSFSLSYSHEATSSDDEEDKVGAGCGGRVTSIFATRPWPSSGSNRAGTNETPEGAASKLTAAESESRSIKKRHHHPSMEQDEDNFAFVHQEQQTSFFLASDNESTAITPRSSGYSQQRYSTEKSSLLPPATPVPHGSSLYTLSESLTPPASSFRRQSQRQDATNIINNSQLMGAPPAIPPLTNGRKRMSKKQQEDDRVKTRQRRRHRKRKLRKLQEARERKVPTYLRVAHAKARAIAERFLGLLRAETEKVLLFAQSRLGELADTAGSLRFPSFGDDHFHGRQKREIRGTQYDYTLSDGGMHPSASSSSDDEQHTAGTGTTSIFPWSDSDDEADKEAPGRTDETASQSLMSSFRTPRFGGSRKTTATTITNVRRKISHFKDIRNSRPIFQRIDHILGEDMLFLSAVEEADGYTAVAAELLHVLRFICVNLIAVRKICRKHDRLLMNRMLGGYYHRTQSFESGHLGDSRTLGGILAHASNDFYEAHPASIGQVNHFKLVGIYDTKIQKLANSRTVQVISSCLALALSEYEVARSRADALTTLNSSSSRTPKQSRPRLSHSADESEDFTQSAFDSDGDSEGPPSTESTMCLTRLRFAVSSIFSLREAARYKYNQFDAYLSRASFAFVGQQVVGEGLDGCSRRTLDFIVSYDPDSVLLHDPRILFEGLQDGKWSKRRLGRVMNSTLAASIIGERSAFTRKPEIPLSKEEYKVLNAVSVVPENKLASGSLGILSTRKIFIDNEPSMIPEITARALRLNYASCFLFMTNYFVAHPTSAVFVRTLDDAPARSALINGAPNISAILCAIFHAWYISHEIASNTFPRRSAGTMRYLLAIAAFMGFCGNGLQSVAVAHSSLSLAVLSRLIIGFSFSEILSRQLLRVCLPSLLVREAARFTMCKIAGWISGLLLGTMAEAFANRFDGNGITGTQYYLSCLLSLLWFTLFVCICRSSNAIAVNGFFEDRRTISQLLEVDANNTDKSDGESDESPSILQQSSSDESSQDESNPLKAAYGSRDSSRTDLRSGDLLSETDDQVARSRPNFLCRTRTLGSMIRKLLRFHAAIPVMLVLLAFAVFGWELLMSATPIVVARYFEWNEAFAGVFLFWLAMLMVPAHYISSRVAHRFDERTILKRSLYMVAVGLFGMINWISIYSLAGHVPSVFADIVDRGSRQYDWRLGVIQYTVGASLVFAGLTSLSGAATSLLSKVSPHRQKSVMVNVGTMVTLISLCARLFANGQILLVDLSTRAFIADLVNSLTIPMFLICLGLLHVVKKHYFYLT